MKRDQNKQTSTVECQIVVTAMENNKGEGGQEMPGEGPGQSEIVKTKRARQIFERDLKEVRDTGKQLSGYLSREKILTLS